MNQYPGLAFDWTSWIVSLSTLLLLSAWGDAGEVFRLEVPDDPRLSSDAEIDRNSLTITDSRGQRHVYTRRPEFDSRDGQFVAYFGAAASQYVRWPRNGHGAMYIGTETGRTISWRESRMRVVQQRPLDPRSSDAVAHSAASRGRSRIPLRVATIVGPRGELTAGQIDDSGSLHYYQLRNDDSWRHRAVKLPEKLVPGAALSLFESSISDLPSAVSVSGRGELIEIGERSPVRRIADRSGALFLPHGHLEASVERGMPIVYAVDTRGRIWQVDVARQSFHAVESREGMFRAGSPLSVSRNSKIQLFVVDLRGQLVRYVQVNSNWRGPLPVRDGFSPAAAIAATEYQPSNSVGQWTVVAAVDAGGQLRLLTSGNGDSWIDQHVSKTKVASAGIDVAQFGDQLVLTAIDTSGAWRQWQRKQSGDWRSSTIGDGFEGASFLAYAPAGERSFAVDRLGRIVTAHQVDHRWHSVICSPDYDVSRRLVRREVIPNPPLNAVRIELFNGGTEELVVRAHDRRAAEISSEIRIPPDSGQTFNANRDAGSTYVETILTVGPRGDVVEQVVRQPVPPQTLYDLTVYANRVTSVYFDRTQNRSQTPDKVSQSLVSIGAFPLPPGNLLRDGQRIDVLQEARSRGNPGAVSLFDRQRRP